MSDTTPTVAELQEKITEMKVRIFDLAEANEEVHKAYQSQAKQMQEFVTVVAQIAGMELDQEVKLDDVVKAIAEKANYVPPKAEEVEEVTE